MRSAIIRCWKRFAVLGLLASMVGCATVAPQPPKQPAEARDQEQEEITARLYTITEIALQEAREEFRADPSSPVKNFIPRLEETLAYAEEVQNGDCPYDPDEVFERVQEVREMGINIGRGVARVLETDVSFASGKYQISDLLDDGERVLQDTFKEIREFVEEFQKKFPDDRVVIVLKTTGYADEVPPRVSLERELATGITAPIPRNPIKRRQLFNKELSYRRAATINNYLISRCRTTFQQSDVGVAKAVIRGFGETYPYPSKDVTPPYQSADKRRRICKIYGSVFTSKFYDKHSDVLKQ